MPAKTCRLPKNTQLARRKFPAVSAVGRTFHQETLLDPIASMSAAANATAVLWWCDHVVTLYDRGSAGRWRTRETYDGGGQWLQRARRLQEFHLLEESYLGSKTGCNGKPVGVLVPFPLRPPGNQVPSLLLLLSPCCRACPGPPNPFPIGQVADRKPQISSSINVRQPSEKEKEEERERLPATRATGMAFDALTLCFGPLR